MDNNLISHPATAEQASRFVAPGSLSLPAGHHELTPPSSEKNVQDTTNGVATPAATPDAQNSATSGIGKLHKVTLFFLQVVNRGNLSPDPPEHRCYGQPLGAS